MSSVEVFGANLFIFYTSVTFSESIPTFSHCFAFPLIYPSDVFKWLDSDLFCFIM